MIKSKKRGDGASFSASQAATVLTKSFSFFCFFVFCFLSKRKSRERASPLFKSAPRIAQSFHYEAARADLTSQNRRNFSAGRVGGTKAVDFWSVHLQKLLKEAKKKFVGCEKKRTSKNIIAPRPSL